MDKRTAFAVLFDYQSDEHNLPRKNLLKAKLILRHFVPLNGKINYDDSSSLRSSVYKANKV